MKVFLSWSGEKSHKVALIFRDWFPAVIQSLKPYVSSEDIDKGARWSTDIAAELHDSTYGILCVTKDNLTAPWLTFEAGALSKTMDKAFVSPFLFDMKRSEVDGPILQFQSTIFDKEDILKLVKSLNKACGEEKLSNEHLEKAFEVWYPSLEKSLNELKSSKKADLSEDEQEVANNEANEILEEILDISRLNQKILRGSNTEMSNEFRGFIDRLEMLLSSRDLGSKKRPRKMHPGFWEELTYVSAETNSNAGFHIALSLLKDDFPWIYESGRETLQVLTSKKTKSAKVEALEDFTKLVEFSVEHPMVRDMVQLENKDTFYFIRELPYMLSRLL